MRESTAPGLRMKTRRAVTEALADTALDLFDRAGFDQVTVADIVAAAGISQRSFFRYFSSKEDVVFGDRIPSAEEVRGELLRHLDDLPPWDALRATFRTAAHQLDADQGHWKRAARVICRNPGLRARYLEKHLAWTDALAPEIVSRTTPRGPRGGTQSPHDDQHRPGLFRRGPDALVRQRHGPPPHPPRRRRVRVRALPPPLIRLRRT
ncbi:MULTISPECIES: TetR family transcriptional regulator [unclassified Streptomyces]|uniref:TetR family transcriptional regulator n=1 Tax=unclassified Streptomyces TaxID=2593676 RepID=UPI000A88258B|nr:TetR family transcriptional regulator [Streptomyces sp. BvitLS-983]